MKIIRKALCALLAALTLTAAAAVAAPSALAEDYQDGDYTVSFKMEGLGRHNIAWDTATVHIRDGAIYVDFTLERVDPRDHAPQYDYLRTDYGTFYPELDDASYTCTFYGVQVSHLGRVSVSALTSAMSQPYEVDYVLIISDAGIPVKQAEPEPTPTPTPTPAPAPTPTPTPAPAPTPTPSDPSEPDGSAQPADPAKAADAETFRTFVAQQAEAIAKLAQKGDSAAAAKLIDEAKKAVEAMTFDESKSLEENEKIVTDLLAALTADLAAQREKDKAGEKNKDGSPIPTDGETDTQEPTKKSAAPVIIGVICGAAAIAVVVWLLLRRKK